MTCKRAAVLAATAIAAFAAAPAPAQPGMGMIGQKIVGAELDRDTITARGDEPSREIMFCVEEAPVHFQEVTVRFANGTAQNIRLRSLVAAGRCSRTIELRGGNRDIASVDFTYQSASLGGGRARIQLYAR